MQMKIFNRGFVSLSLVLIIVVGLAIVGGTGYYLTLPHTPSVETTNESGSTTAGSPQAPTESTSVTVVATNKEKAKAAPQVLPTCTLTAKPDTVFPSEVITLTWESSNASTISLNEGQGATFGGLPAKGSQSVKAQKVGVITPSLTVSGPNGSAACATKVTITPVDTRGSSNVSGKMAPAGFLIPSSTTVPLGFKQTHHLISSTGYSVVYEQDQGLLQIQGFTDDGGKGIYSYEGNASAARESGRPVQEFTYNGSSGIVVMHESSTHLYWKDSPRYVTIVGRNSVETTFTADVLISILKTLVRQ